MSYCARCKRPLTRPPVLVEGRGYGPTCAGKVRLSDLLAPPPRIATPRQRRASAAEVRQLQLAEAQP